MERENFYLTKKGRYKISGVGAHSEYGENIYIESAGVDFYIDKFTISNAGNLTTMNNFQIRSQNAGDGGSEVTINNALISNIEVSNQSSAICVFNSGGAVTHYLTVNNCQIANYSTTSACIQTSEGATYGELELVLINSILWNKTYAYSISKGLATATLNVRPYNSYSNKPIAISTVSPTLMVSNILVDSNVIFNQGQAL